MKVACPRARPAERQPRRRRARACGPREGRSPSRPGFAATAVTAVFPRALRPSAAIESPEGRTKYQRARQPETTARRGRGQREADSDGRGAKSASGHCRLRIARCECVVAWRCLRASARRGRYPQRLMRSTPGDASPTAVSLGDRECSHRPRPPRTSERPSVYRGERVRDVVRATRAADSDGGAHAACGMSLGKRAKSEARSTTYRVRPLPLDGGASVTTGVPCSPWR